MSIDNPYEPPEASLVLPNYKLDPKKIIAGALVFVFEKKLILGKALAIPFVLYLIIDLASGWNVSAIGTLLLAIGNLVVQSVFAITTHRVMLLGDGSVPKWGLHSWTKRETYFLIHVIGLALLAGLTALFGLIPLIGGLVALVLIVWITSRLSLVFPAIAIDQGVSFSLAWRLSKKHQLPLIVVVCVFPVVLGIPTILISTFALSTMVASLLGTLTTVFTIAALSICYREIHRFEYSDA